MKTKKLMVAMMVMFMFISAQDMSGQSIELNGFTGIQLGGTARLYDGDFKINDAQNYGGKIAFGVSSSTYAEISYMRSDTEGRFYPAGFGQVSDLVPFSSNYIQLGGLQEVDMGRVAPFVTVAAGLTVWDPKTTVLATKTQFSATVGAGLKLWLTDAIGIRLQGSMLMPMVFNGFGFGCGIGTGGTSCGSQLYTRVTPFQGEFSGGLIIKLSAN